ncbi:hypothetical protein IWW54_000323 [Coemansia sp. RSA 2705]|nr:hypothetical protein IWW54_000323 [Coemansia sp. RSA 2705]
MIGMMNNQNKASKRQNQELTAAIGALSVAASEQAVVSVRQNEELTAAIREQGRVLRCVAESQTEILAYVRGSGGPEPHAADPSMPQMQHILETSTKAGLAVAATF